MTCLPFLLRHIALVRPRRLVLLGALATKAITGRTDGIRRLRGRWLELTIPGLDQPLATLPMLHPAYLLRTAGAKRDAWGDLLSLRRALDGDNAVVTEKSPVTH
jgi:DNA polymerase